MLYFAKNKAQQQTIYIFVRKFLYKILNEFEINYGYITW